MIATNKTQPKNTVQAALKTSPYRQVDTQDKAAVPVKLMQEIARAIGNIRGWGSVEIFIQDNKVTQITERNIKKTNAQLLGDD